MRRQRFSVEQKQLLRDALKTADEAAHELAKLLGGIEGLAERRKALQVLENRAAQQERTAVEGLMRQRRGNTRRDRAMELARAIHRITNAAYAVSNRLVVYGISKATPEMAPFGEILLAQTRELTAAAAKAQGDRADAEGHLQEVRRLERDADARLNEALTALFRDGTDPLRVLKHKEIYEVLETATDRCEDAADALAWLLWAP